MQSNEQFALKWQVFFLTKSWALLMERRSAKFKAQDKIGQFPVFLREVNSEKKTKKNQQKHDLNRDNTTLFWFQHLFALRSKHKGQHRTYYLAADSELDMTKWVECLCNVCGCKPVDNQDEGRFNVKNFVHLRIKCSFTLGERDKDISRFCHSILADFASRPNSLYFHAFLEKLA